MNFLKKSKGGGRGGSFPIRKISLLIWCYSKQVCGKNRNIFFEKGAGEGSKVVWKFVKKSSILVSTGFHEEYECYAGLAEPTDPLTQKWTKEATLYAPSPPLRWTSTVGSVFLKSKKIAVKSVGKNFVQDGRLQAWPVQRWCWPPRWACQGWRWELKQQFHVFRLRRFQSR